MKFSKEFLQNMEGRTKSDVITSHRRWSVGHRRVFEHEGKHYETHYSVGATEQQDESPYENADVEIECLEVRPVEKTVIVYEPVSDSRLLTPQSASSSDPSPSHEAH